jgi:hypothetical protein
MPVSETPRTTVADGPGNATIASGKRAVQITASEVQPPTPLYLQTEDSLLLLLSSPILQTYAGLALILRWLRPDGEVVSIRKPVSGAGSNAQLAFTLGEGFLLSATLSGLPTAPTYPGSTFATLVVQRDTPEAAIYSWVLFADYVTISHFPSWPFGRNVLSQEGPGRLRSIVGSTPAAGAEINEVVPSNVRWRLMAIRFLFTTSATVINRRVSFLRDDGVNAYEQMDSSFTQAASIATFYSANQNGGVTAAGDASIRIQTDTSLLQDSTHRIRTSTQNIQAGDQYSAPVYLVQEWINN